MPGSFRLLSRWENRNIISVAIIKFIELFKISNRNGGLQHLNTSCA